MRKAKNRRGKWLGRGVAVLVIAALVSFFLKTRAERKGRGDERFTLIVWNGMMTVASFDPVTERGLKLILPPELEVVTVGGRGRWQGKVLPQIGEKYGGKWVADSVADYLSVGYTAYAKSDNLSGINLWDRFNWWQWSRKVRWEELELKTLPGVVEAKAADGQVSREGRGEGLGEKEIKIIWGKKDKQGWLGEGS